MELIDFRRLRSESEGRDGGSKIPTMAIVSAMYGFTDLLVAAVNAAVVDYDDACKQMDAVVDKQIATIRELAPPEISKEVEDRIKADGVQVAPPSCPNVRLGTLSARHPNEIHFGKFLVERGGQEMDFARKKIHVFEAL
jgi:hypothetical protein